MSVKLSALIITFNEERNIRDCIESISGVADEVIVLDSFSKDQTKEICQEYELRFEQHNFDGHVEQKNRAVGLSSNDWVLSLDADERLSEDLKESILSAKENGFNGADGFSFNRKNFYAGKWIRYSDWYPDRKIRLWNRKCGSWQGVNPHDKVVLIETSTEKQLKGDLLHYTFASSSDHFKQAVKFGRIGGTMLQERNKIFLLFKWIFSPSYRFFKMFFLRLGFLDGWRGFSIAAITSYEVWLKYGIGLGLIKGGKR